MDKVLYFAYGANREPRMMAAITGNKNLVGRPAVLKGFKLCVQRLDQVPEKPRKILKDNWPETFTSYTIKEDRHRKVAGNIYPLTPLERELVRDWELIDLGWYEDKKAKAVTEDGMKIDVQTEGLRAGQEVNHKVNGITYESWLQPPEDLERVAEKSRREYFEKIGQTPEGKVKTGIES